MSETQLTEYQHMTCDECGNDVRVRQDSKRGLELTCDCNSSRSIKVKRAIPFSWSDA